MRIAVQPCGDSSAMEALRKMYPSRDNFVILEIEWET